MGAGASSKVQQATQKAGSLASGILRVNVIEGRELSAKNEDGLSDPWPFSVIAALIHISCKYLVLIYGFLPAQSTEVRHSSLTPQWNQILDFPVWKIPPEVPGLEEPRVTIKCWDWEEKGQPNYMGSTEVSVEDLVLDGEEQEGWYTLEDPNDPTVQGMVRITVRWMTRPDAAPDAVLSVSVQCAQELPPIGSSGFADPYVLVKFKKLEERTAVQARTLDPDWRESVEFPVLSTEVRGELVEVQCWHKGTIRDRMIGVVYVKLSEVNFEVTAHSWYVLEKQSKEGAAGGTKRKKAKDDDEYELGRISLAFQLKTQRTGENADIMIRVAVLEAKKLPPRTRSETSDPYFVVQFEKSKHKTQVRFKQTPQDRPSWSEVFSFNAWSDRLDSVLRVTAMDHQEWLKDERLGSVAVNLLDLPIGDLNEKWFVLEDQNHPDSQAEVKLQILLRQKVEEKDHDAQLRVRVIEAKNLPAMDYGGTSDPYIVLTFEGKNRKTSTMFKTLHPVWNENLLFPTSAADLDTLLTVECFDYDFASKDDSCGKCDVDLTGMQLNQTIAQWLPLRDLAHPEWQGEVLVEILLMPMAEELEPDSSLTVKVVGAKDLIASDSSGTSDPYVVVQFLGKTKRTGTRFKTIAPQFDEEFEFVTHSTNVHEAISFEVFDYDLVGANDSLGRASFRIGDLQTNRISNVWLPLKLRESANELGELNVEILIKKLPEFSVFEKERSKSLDISQPFTDIITAMTQTPKMYELDRKFSLSASGIKLDFEATSGLLAEEEEPELEEWQRIWNEEQETRRLYDVQRASELRQETVELNVYKGRNYGGRCAWCGEPFSILAKAVQCQTDRLWYHSFSARTVKSQALSCYEKHKPDMRKRLKRQLLRDKQHDEEMVRRLNWDRDFERQRALETNRKRLKKAVMTDGVGKLAKRTRQKEDATRPPHSLWLVFPEEDFVEYTTHDRERRAFLQAIQHEVAFMLNLEDRRVSTNDLNHERSAVEVRIYDDSEGRDKWTPEALAKKLLSQLLGKHRPAKLYDAELLMTVMEGEIRGPIISPVAEILLSPDDIQTHKHAKAKPLPPPDQAGRMPVHVFISGDLDDMRPEREFLATQIFPILDRWLKAFRVLFVPVDLRKGVTRSECYHRNCVKIHLDEIDYCHPFFVSMLGENYGFIPDQYFRNYGDLEQVRLQWIKEMPDNMSLTHLEIVHAYFNRKEDDSETPGGGNDDDFCYFYLRDRSWLTEPGFITDLQLQQTKFAAEKKAEELRRLKDAAKQKELEKLEADAEEIDRNSDYVDIHVIEGLALAYMLEKRELVVEDVKSEKLSKKSKQAMQRQRRSSLQASQAMSKAADLGKKGLLAVGMLSGGALLYGGKKLAQGVGKSAFAFGKGLEAGHKAGKRARSAMKKKRRHRPESGGESEHSEGQTQSLREQREQSAASQSEGGGTSGVDQDEDEDEDDEEEEDEETEASTRPTSTASSAPRQRSTGKGRGKGKKKKIDPFAKLEKEEDDEESGKKKKGWSLFGRKKDDEEDDEEDDEDDDEDDDDLDEDAVRKELEGDLQKVAIRMPTITDHQHENLVGELKVLVKKHVDQEKMVELVEKVYGTRWWNCERMREYWTCVKEDKARVMLLDGKTNLYKRCMDPDSGDLPGLIQMIKSKELRIALEQKLEAFQNESKSRAAVKGLIHVEEESESEDADTEGGTGGETSGGATPGAGGVSGAESGADGADGDGAEGGAEGEEGEVQPEEPKVKEITTQADGKLAYRGKGRMFGTKWVVRTAIGDATGEMPVLQLKGLFKLDLRSYDVAPDHEPGAEGEWIPLIQLQWNGAGWQPKRPEVTLRAQTVHDRDWWIQWITEMVAKFPPLESLPDGSEKLDCLGPLRFKSGSSVLSGSIDQDCALLCLTTKEACEYNGLWSEDWQVPKSFAFLELVPSGELEQLQAKHQNIAARAAAHAETICDKVVKFFQYEGRGIALKADQFGFSKELVDYETQDVIWHADEDGALEKYEKIIQNSLEVSEKKIATGELAGIGGGGLGSRTAQDQDGSAALEVASDGANGVDGPATGDEVQSAEQLDPAMQEDDPSREGGSRSEEEREPKAGEHQQQGQAGSADGLDEAGEKREEQSEAGPGTAADGVASDGRGGRNGDSQGPDDEDSRSSANDKDDSNHGREERKVAAAGGDFGNANEEGGNGQETAPQDAQAERAGEGAAPEVGAHETPAAAAEAEEGDGGAKADEKEEEIEVENLDHWNQVEAEEAFNAAAGLGGKRTFGSSVLFDPDADIPVAEDIPTARDAPDDNAQRLTSLSQHEDDEDHGYGQLLLLHRQIVELFRDDKGEPLRLENQFTKEPLWMEDKHMVQQLEDLLKDAVPVDVQLFVNGTISRPVLQCGSATLELTGTIRDFDNPRGQPKKLLNNETREVVWEHNMPHAWDEYTKIAKNPKVIGHNVTVLRSLYDFKGEEYVLVEDDHGKEKQILRVATGEVFWDVGHEHSAESLQEFMREAAAVGMEMVSHFEKGVDHDRPRSTLIDLRYWIVAPKDKNKLQFTWDAADKDIHKFGTVLETQFRRLKMPKVLLARAKDAQDRDRWFKLLRAARQWAIHQDAERNKWQVMSKEYEAQTDSGKGVRPLGEILQITEDQMDAYRQYLYLLLDHNYSSLQGKKQAAIDAMEEFKEALIQDLVMVSGVEAGRFDVKRVLKGSSKASWKSIGREPKFYLSMAKKCRQGAVLAEVVIEPDKSNMEARMRNPDDENLTNSQSSREIGELLVRDFKKEDSMLKQGAKTGGLVHLEAFSGADEDDANVMQGLPVWLEFELGTMRKKTHVKGSQKAVFNELIRFKCDEDARAGFVIIHVFTTKGSGKRRLGMSTLSVATLVANQTVPMTLPIEENEHGLIVLQVKYVPKVLGLPGDEAKRLARLPKPVKTAFPYLGLRQRHISEDEAYVKRLSELKEVLNIEATVYNNYPCFYDGVDAQGRTKLSGLESFGDRVAEDVFSGIRARGLLKMSMERPLQMLSIEGAQYGDYRREQSKLCVGRYELLKECQEYVHGKEANTILVLTGPSGCGKSNVMACLHQMFDSGQRIRTNANTKLLEFQHHKAFDASKRGSSWDNPEVVSIFMDASNGNNTSRYFLYMLMNAIASILAECTFPLEQTIHRVTVPPTNPADLFPIPEEFNRLRLQFLTLCENVDKFVPSRKILILCDQLDAIDKMRFDWLPIDLPKSLRVVLSCTMGNVVHKMVGSSKTLQFDVRQVQPMTMLARKEMIHHTLKNWAKKLTVDQKDVLVQHREAGQCDFMAIALHFLVDFDKKTSLATKMIVEMSEDFDGLANQALDAMEQFCGPLLVTQALSFICMSYNGLTELELMMLVSAESLKDDVEHRLPEEGMTALTMNPRTPQTDRHNLLQKTMSLLPYGIWSPLKFMLKPFLKKTSSVLSPLYWFHLNNFRNAAVERYNLTNSDRRRELHSRLSAYFWARADPELQFSWRSTDYRATQGYIQHLIAAGKWEEVCRSLNDVGFIELCVHLGRPYGLCEDIARAVISMEREAPKETAELYLASVREMQRFVSGNAQLLTEHPSLLLQLMANEPQGAVNRCAMRRVQQGWEGRNWFRRLHGAHEHRGGSNLTMRGHKGWIRALAVTRDGKYIVSGADDRSARFWEANSGALIHVLSGHREAISCVDVSSNGLYLITGSMDSSVKLWDIRSGIELANLYVGSAATSCAFSHNAQFILAGTQNATLHIFATKTFQELHVLHGHRLGIRCCMFSLDSTRLMSSASDAFVMVWDLAAILRQGNKEVMEPTKVLTGHRLGVRALAWNPRDAGEAASGGDDCSIIIWDLQASKQVFVFEGHDAPVLSLAFTPSGSYLVSASHDSSVRVWDMVSETHLFKFEGHSGPVYTVVVTLDEFMAVSAGADSTIRSWSLRGLLRDDPDERQIGTPHTAAAPGHVRFKIEDEDEDEDESANGVTNEETQAEDAGAEEEEQSNSSSGIGIGKGEREQRVHEEPAVKERMTLQYGDIYSMSFSPSGDKLVSASQDSSYALRNIATGEILGDPRRGHAGPINVCHFHPEGTVLLTGAQDKLVKVWEANTGRLLLTLRGHEDSVTGASFLPTGTRILSCSTDHSIRLWDIETAREISKLPPHLGHISPVRCCSVSSDDRVVATGGDDDFIRVWDLRGNQLARKLISHSRPILDVTFSCDGSSIVSGSLDRSARLWDLSGYLVHKWETHQSAVTAVACTPSGRHLVTGSRDKHVVIYSSTTLQEVGRWVCQSACQSVAATSAKGGLLACGDTTGMAYLLRGVLSPCGEWRYF